MIAFLLGVLLLWLLWRWAMRPLAVALPPPPPAVTVYTPSIVIHLHIRG
jgi:hypothetical protein